jgi:hypothetical protein
MRRQQVLERSVVASIMRRLREQPGLVVRKRHGTAMGVAGDPDLYGSIRGRPSDLTELQRQRLTEWRLAGALVGVARNVEDALIILDLRPPATLP